MDTREPSRIELPPISRPISAGLALSLLLHVAAGILLVHGVEVSRRLPGVEEEPVEVVLVSPDQGREQAVGEPEAEDPATPGTEVPIPPENQDKTQEDARDDAEPETETQAGTQAGTPPPPEPAAPKPPETALEEPAPEEPAAEAAAEDPAQTDPATDSEAAAPDSVPEAEALPEIPVLRPVTEFGEEDSGNRQLDGDSASDEATLKDAQADREPGVEAVEETAEEVAEEVAEEMAVADPDDPRDAATAEDAAPAQEAPAETAPAPEVLGADAAGEEGGPAVPEPAPAPGETPAGTPAGEDLLAGGRVTGGGAVLPPEKPADMAAIAARAQVSPRGGGMRRARRLFSEQLSDDPRVRVAMRGMPHAMRADLLCMTELRGQLRGGTPSYDPDFLPSFRLNEGTVLEPKRAAFRASGRWYDLAFRCELNPEITRVERFSFRVGAPVPRSEWRARGFPVN